MKKVLLFTVFLLAPAWCLADNHDTSIVEMWKCSLKDGKTMEEVQAVNKRWLAMTRKVAGTEEINSYSLETVVGDLTIFGFADASPDMATYAKVKAAEAQNVVRRDARRQHRSIGPRCTLTLLATTSRGLSAQSSFSASSLTRFS